MIAKLFLLLGAQSPERYIKSAFWIALTKFLSIGISLASTFYIARTLGPQNLGELTYAVSIVNLLAFFGAIASSTVIVRDLVKEGANQRNILGTAWVLISLGILVTVICVAALALVLPHDSITLLVVAILCLAQLCTPFHVSQYIFYAKAETKHISLSQLGIHIGISLAKIIAMMYGQGVLVLAAIMFFEQFFIASINVFLYTRYTNIKLLSWEFDMSYAKKLALDSIPFVFITMSSVVSGRIDQVFIKHYIDTATVGLYSVAVQLTEMWQVLPLVLLSSLFPALVNSHVAQNKYRNRIISLILLFGFFSLFASLATSLLAPLLVPIIYGNAFSASIPLLQIYVWSLFGTVVGILITNILVTENFRRIQIMVGLVPMLINVILNMLWIPMYGATGAAWATVISYTLAPIIPFFYSSIRQKLYATKTSTDLD